ncbi:MAG TPA: hypothetical protein V6D03_13565 [Candidatus Caenarcaniphilales bacterium]
MIRFIKNLFSGILTFIGNLFSFGKQEKPQLAPSNAGSPKKASASNQVKEVQQPMAQNNSRKAAPTSYYLDSEEAQGFKSRNGSQPEKDETGKVKTLQPTTAEKTKVSQPPAAANPLNLPQLKVTSYAEFSNYGDRRRPGANMNDFLKMARQMKTSS